MEGRSANFNNSNFTGNLIQGDAHGNVEANIESGSGNKFMSENYNQDLRGANVANNASKVADNARQQANQYNQVSEQKQTLAEAAAEIQELLKQLQQSNPTATDAEKVAYVNDETTPSFKSRVVGALRAGGEIAIEELFDNPYLNVGKAIVKGWVKPE